MRTSYNWCHAKCTVNYKSVMTDRMQGKVSVIIPIIDRLHRREPPLLSPNTLSITASIPMPKTAGIQHPPQITNRGYEVVVE